jgi:nucleotide-binding universal stress UspA family protein
MKRILLPLDGSPCSEAAVPLAKEMAADTGASIVVMTVGNLPETATMAREEKEELLGMLERMTKEYQLNADPRVEMGGDPAQGILTVADEENADLIVMATHGRSGLSEFTQGSVAREVVRDGRKPVLLVRPKEGTQ